MSLWKSPDAFISRTMLQPPMNCPPTYSWESSATGKTPWETPSLFAELRHPFVDQLLIHRVVEIHVPHLKT